MEECIDVLDYYYDEDFSIPFDIGLTEENNNSNINGDYVSRGLSSYGFCDDDDEDDNDEQYRENEIRKFIMPVNLIYNDMGKKFNKHKDLRNMSLRHSFDGEIRKPDTSQSAVKMSCSSSSSPPSSTSINFTDEKMKCFYNNKLSIYESRYSLKSRVPIIAMDNGRILANYHLNFVPNDYLTSSQIINSYIDKNLITDVDKTSDMCSSEFSFSESSKSASLTVDNILFKNFENYYKDIYGVSSLDSIKVKPEAIIWRQIRFILSHYYYGWSLIQLYRQFRKKPKSRCQSTDDIFSCIDHQNYNKRRQRNSCTVLELYNIIVESEKQSKIPEKCDQEINTSYPKSVQHFSCQFPPKPPIKKITKQKSLTDSPLKRSNQDYPGIGKVNLPKAGRLHSSSLLCNEFHNQLSFLQASFSSNDDFKLCKYSSFNQEFHDKSGLKPCLRKENGMSESYTALYPRQTDPDDPIKPDIIKRRPIQLVNKTSSDSNKRKSVSFDCPDLSVEDLFKVRAIPRKWGLLGSQSQTDKNSPNSELMAMFEYVGNSDKTGTGINSSKIGSHQNSGQKGTGFFDRRSSNDDSFRLKDVGTELLRSVRQISDRIGIITDTTDSSPVHYHPLYQQQQLVALCESVCTGQPGDDSSPLASAVDGLLQLLADGLAGLRIPRGQHHTSSNSTYNNKVHVRLWLLVEETTKACPELHQLARDSRLVAIRDQHTHHQNHHHHITSNNSNSHHHSQQRLRIFIAKSFASGLLHIWLNSVTTNEAALSKFYAPSAFIRRPTNAELFATLIQSFKSIHTAQQSQQKQKPQHQDSPPTPVPNYTPIITKTTSTTKSQVPAPSMPPPVTISRRTIQTTTNTSHNNRNNKNHSTSTPTKLSSTITTTTTNNHYKTPSSKWNTTQRTAPLYSAETTESGESFADSHSSPESSSYPLINHTKPTTIIIKNNNNNRDITNNNHHNYHNTKHLKLQHTKPPPLSSNHHRIIPSHKKSSSLLSSESSGSNNTSSALPPSTDSSTNIRFQSPSRKAPYKNVSLPLKTIRNQPLLGTRQK